MLGSYVAATPSTPYQPLVSVAVRAVDLASGAALYREFLTYGLPPPYAADSIQLPADAGYRFADFDALLSDPAKAREGLLAGLERLAQQVAADLKPK